jgi:hypothetical protein
MPRRGGAVLRERPGPRGKSPDGRVHGSRWPDARRGARVRRARQGGGVEGLRR